ncbi:hypothetical protein ACFE04_013386 [Oxalis oulophora]
MEEEEEGLVHGQRISTVVPAKVTGENKVYNLTNIDLAMKFHYIKTVYFFQSDAVKGLSIYDLKQPMFDCLEISYTASGRIRRSESDKESSGGRPVIRCNDGGVRVVEANCEKTVDEWLEMEDRSHEFELLAYDLALGPDLGFSPLVYVQFTWFKCGGISVGLSWAHVLGDAFSASSFINLWSKILSSSANHLPRKPLNLPRKSPSPLIATSSIRNLALKQVNPIGPDHWLISNPCKTKTHTFTIPTTLLDDITKSSSMFNPNVSHFDLISAMIWKIISKIRGSCNVVTICANGSRERIYEIPSNEIDITCVEGETGDVWELALLIAEKKIEQNSVIEETMKGCETGDYIVYGANLTFLNMEGSNVYDLKINGLKPVFVNCGISGVGDEGVVVVIPVEDKIGVVERTVTVVLRENEIGLLKIELQKEWDLA